MNELCDEKRFTKAVSGGLYQIRNGVHDGLFTANMEEENWSVNFNSLSINDVIELYGLVLIIAGG